MYISRAAEESFFAGPEAGLGYYDLKTQRGVKGASGTPSRNSIVKGSVASGRDKFEKFWRALLNASSKVMVKMLWSLTQENWTPTTSRQKRELSKCTRGAVLK